MKTKETKKQQLFSRSDISYLAVLLGEDLRQKEERVDTCSDLGLSLSDSFYRDFFEKQDLYNRLIEFLAHE